MASALPRGAGDIRDRRADQLAEAGALVERQLPEPPMRVLVKGNGRGLHPRSLRRLGRCPPPPCPRPLPRGSRHTVPPPPAPRGWSWPDLLRHSFAVDVSDCPRRGSRMRVVATIEDPVVIRKLLTHLGLPTAVPPAQVTAD